MILVAGSANIDFMTRVAHIPAPGETILGGDYVLAAGGKGANQAVACARAGGQVAFLGALGQDPFAAMLRGSLQESGVRDLTFAATKPTGAASISVADSGENAITVASGANAVLEPGHLPALQGYEYLILQLEIPLDTVTAYAQAAQAAGVKVVLNAAPARPLPEALLSSTDILVVNEGELATIVGAEQSLPVSEQLRRAQALGPGTVTVTLGAQGNLTRQGEQEIQVAASRVSVRDTTGAGDTFVGSLVAALTEGQPLAQALHFASVGAALACTRTGAQPSMPLRSEIDQALQGQWAQRAYPRPGWAWRQECLERSDHP